MRPVPIHNGMMWVNMLYAGIGGVGALAIGHIVSLCMSLIPFVVYTNTMKVGLNNTYMFQAVCHPMCMYKHSMHIRPLYSTNNMVLIIVFGPLFCIGGLFWYLIYIIINVIERYLLLVHFCLNANIIHQFTLKIHFVNF